MKWDPRRPPTVTGHVVRADPNDPNPTEHTPGVGELGAIAVVIVGVMIFAAGFVLGQSTQTDLVVQATRTTEKCVESLENVVARDREVSE